MNQPFSIQVLYKVLNNLEIRTYPSGEVKEFFSLEEDGLYVFTKGYTIIIQQENNGNYQIEKYNFGTLGEIKTNTDFASVIKYIFKEMDFPIDPAKLMAELRENLQ